MNYVESFNLLGIEAKQIPCIKGNGAPTEMIEGAVGCFYMDVDTGDVYKCTSTSGSAITWVLMGGNTGESNLTLEDTVLANSDNPVKSKAIYEYVELGLSDVRDSNNAYADHVYESAKSYTDDQIANLDLGGGNAALPVVTSTDAGKFLRVSPEGTWIAETLSNAEEVAF